MPILSHFKREFLKETILRREYFLLGIRKEKFFLVPAPRVVGGTHRLPVCLVALVGSFTQEMKGMAGEWALWLSFSSKSLLT